ncbi:hypothetical protein KUTeg_000994 [Tegillarca granosa]|uniref:DDE Tnp4 domain-containing protein n=1 Tax=Tegillarca granosa TaxID=220873 RepID=A0ABQ9FW64_TEGGR|nr:hypothetical protein KUTeg_000994 [Tegillarca granosa]
MPKLSPGNVIMADKGFTIDDLLLPNFGLNVSPRVSSKSQMPNTIVLSRPVNQSELTDFF